MSAPTVRAGSIVGANLDDGTIVIQFDDGFDVEPLVLGRVAVLQFGPAKIARPRWTSLAGVLARAKTAGRILFLALREMLVDGALVLIGAVLGVRLLGVEPLRAVLIMLIAWFIGLALMTGRERFDAESSTEVSA